MLHKIEGGEKNYAAHARHYIFQHFAFLMFILQTYNISTNNFLYIFLFCNF
jgi:hypothetical protein